MARIEWIKHRLNNWALWRSREASGGLGYATRSVLLAQRVDGYRDIQIPVDDIDAELTNQAVESLRPGKPHLYMTLQHIYIKDDGIKRTAMLMSKAESTIKANLDAADHALAAWFAERSENKKMICST